MINKTKIKTVTTIFLEIIFINIEKRINYLLIKNLKNNLFLLSGLASSCLGRWSSSNVG
jgi:hypothetical protein